MNDTIRLIVIGAHPDDCDIFAGGLAARYKQLGHAVKFVSITNGDAGHFHDGGGTLANRRRQEALNAAKILEIDYEILDNHDGEILPTLHIRQQVIRLIRDWNANVVMTHRPNDYHPDHRYTSTVVQDAAYLVSVPHVCPHVQALKHNPYFFYLMDHFRKPYPFQPDVVIDIDPVMETKWSMVHCHESQVYEWLPFIDGELDQVPAEESRRKDYMKRKWGGFLHEITSPFREAVEKRYGQAKAAAIQNIEAFEICEYGSQPSENDLQRLFPF